jgi:hypothetical protein
LRAAGWYAARLAAMSAPEVVYRMGQVLRRQTRRVKTGRGNALPAAGRAESAAGLSHRASFFDVELPYPSSEPIDWSRDYRSGISAPRVFYGEIDYRDTALVGDSKYTWELNRHQFMVPWALDYARTGDERHATAILSLILDWIAANPRYVGINWVSSLELALRVLSWGICFDLCRNSARVRAARSAIAASVAEQADFIRHTLSLYSSANNHLMGELVGLLAAAAFFPEARGSRTHAEFARARLAEEAARQTFADGVNREQAIYYHHYTLEYLLTAMALLKRTGHEVPGTLRALARRMLDFIDAMTDDQGDPFEVGDGDDGTATGLNLGTGVDVFESLLWSGWLLYEDDVLGAHAARIARSRGVDPGIDPRNAYWYADAARRARLPREASVRRRSFPQGGYFVSRDGPRTLMFKAGPFGYPVIAAHAHCDQLSVGLKHGALTVLTDSGTCVYHGEERWRRFFRGTSAHNTVRVDGEDQAEYAGPFLWSSHADGRMEVVRDEPDRFELWGMHDGYRRLPDPVRHERTVAYRRELGYRVTDLIVGSRPHLYELFWNFGYGVTLEAAGPLDHPPGRGLTAGWRILHEGRPLLGLLLLCSAPGQVHVAVGDEGPPAGFESRRYREKHAIHQLRLQTTATRAELETYLVEVDNAVSSAAILSAAARWS